MRGPGHAGRLFAFAAIAYAFTWQVVSSGGPEALAAFGPALAALVMLLVLPGRGRLDFAAWRSSLTRWPATRAGLLLVFGAPFAFLALGLLAASLAAGGLDLARLRGGPLATTHGLLELLLVGSLLQAVGEEPGWRGWFLPALRERAGPFAATLLLFPVWLFWHLPTFLARPEFGLPQFAGFALGILSAAIWFTAIHELTGSVLAAIIFHVLINATRGVALAISTPAFLGYGMAVTIGAILIAVIAWRRQAGRAPARAAPA